MASTAGPSRERPALSDRARGALLGLAIGDALGAPLVGMGRHIAPMKHGVVTEFIGGGLYLLAPGDNTARVLLARAAAVALAGDPPYAERLRDGYLGVLASDAPGMGEATRAALARLEEGRTPSEAVCGAHDAVERRTAGIGPAIRAVPFALRFHADPTELEEAVLADAASTHRDPRAGAAALALALWVRAHLVGEDDADRALCSVEQRMAERTELPDVLPPRSAVRGLPVRPTAFAPDVLHAVARHALAAKKAQAAIVDAVNEAGESSALGACAGAVVGARFGESGLPRSWLDLLRGASAWRTLADRLVLRSAAAV